MNQSGSDESLSQVVQKLTVIPGIGPKVGMMLAEVGIRDISDLESADPESLYTAACQHRGEDLDRCVLYHFRCAVYYASNETHEAERLKWWYWKENV